MKRQKSYDNFKGFHYIETRKTVQGIHHNAQQSEKKKEKENGDIQNQMRNPKYDGNLKKESSKLYGERGRFP